MMSESVLAIKDLQTDFTVRGETITAVRDLDLVIGAGETVALVGESGCGKSVTSLSIMKLLPKRVGRIAKGSIALRRKSGERVDLRTIGTEQMREIRGNDIGMVFQEPMTSLNPVYTVGEQIAEPIRIHLGKSRREARADAVRLLTDVGIPDPSRRASQFPHELSGGMRQRVTIAMALACDPQLLIADEPTTALDVTIQAQILDLLIKLQQERDMAVLFVTHNLGVVARIADRVAVMYAGRIIEDGPVTEVFAHPSHPYTRGLLNSVPRLGEAVTLRQNGQSLPTIPGSVPSLHQLPDGCAFAGRCGFTVDGCRAGTPPFSEIDPGHRSRCIRWRELQA